MTRTLAESRSIPVTLVLLALAYLFYGLGRFLTVGSITDLQQLVHALTWLWFFLYGLFLFLLGLFKLLGVAKSSYKTLSGLAMSFVALYFICLSVFNIAYFPDVLLFIAGLLFFIYMFNEAGKLHLSLNAVLLIGALIALGIWLWDWSHVPPLFISNPALEGTAAAVVVLGFLLGIALHGKSDIRAFFLAMGAYIYGFALLYQFRLMALSLFSGISLTPAGLIHLGEATASLSGIVLIIGMTINFIGIAKASGASNKV